MRTIAKSIQKRIEAQAHEAKTLGFEKLASDLSNQIEGQPVRSDEDEYVYTYAELKDDVAKQIWKAALSVQDYYGKTVDGRQLAEFIYANADDLIDLIRAQSKSVVGVNEPQVPGEVKERTAIEVEIPNE